MLLYELPDGLPARCFHGGLPPFPRRGNVANHERQQVAEMAGEHFPVPRRCFRRQRFHSIQISRQQAAQVPPPADFQHRRKIPGTQARKERVVIEPQRQGPAPATGDLAAHRAGEVDQDQIALAGGQDLTVAAVMDRARAVGH